MKAKKVKKLMFILIMLGFFSGRVYASNIELLPAPVEIPTGVQNEKKLLSSRYMSGYGLTTQKFNLSSNVKLNVKDQGQDNICWACSSNSVLETTVNKFNNTNDIYDDKYLDTNINNIYGKTTEDGGNALIAFSYYSTMGTPKKVNGEQTNFNISDYVIFPNIFKNKNSDGTIEYTNTNAFFGVKKYQEEEVIKVRNQIKQHIQTYGAVTALTYTAMSTYFNDDYTAYYCDKNIWTPDHQVTIVGWDDNYSKDNFNESHRPSSNGAYIVMNSHGTQYYDNGFLYISYEDAFIEANVFGVTQTQDKTGEKVYQYDELGMNMQLSASKPIYGANIFQRGAVNNKEKGEFITEIGLSTLGQGTYEIYVNSKNNSLESSDLVKVMTVEKEYAGYKEITLNKPIQITGDNFVIAIRAIDGTEKGKITIETSDVNFWQNSKSNQGESFISIDGKDWQDLKTIGEQIKATNANICVKAITEEMDVPGDINKSGTLDIQDLSMLIAHRAEMENYILTEEQLKRADINKDGITDLQDVSKMVMVLAGF